MSGFRPVPARHNNPAVPDLPQQIPISLATCPMVLVRKDGHVPPLAPLYEGPYKVISRSLKTFRLQVGERTDVVSVQRLKPAVTSEEEQPAPPPRRGRPRRVQPDPPPPVQPDPPPPVTRRRGRPRKVAASASTIIPTRRKKVTFKLTPVIIGDIKRLTSGVKPPASTLGGGTVEDDFRPPYKRSTNKREKRTRY